LYKAILGSPDVEVHHEFACAHVQQLAALKYMGFYSSGEVSRQIQEIYGSAIYWSPFSTWIDCSNKATWLISDLASQFPDARFLNLVRDGRKVALSYYKKLGFEMYDDYSVSVMEQWLQETSSPRPPLEKRFWWNIPRQGQPFYDEFPFFNHFERAVYHWVMSNMEARTSLNRIDSKSVLTVKLENLVSNVTAQGEVCEFLGIPYTSSFADSLSSPKNVIVPVDYVMTPEQRAQFERIAATEMAVLGYDLDKREDRIEY